MKQKILYLSFATVIILIILLIIISIWLGRGAEEIKQLQQKEEQQESEFMPQAPTDSPVFFSRPAITRIMPEPKKPLPEEKPIASPEQAETAIDESRQTTRRASSQSTGTTQIETEPDEFSQEPPTPGITKIGKFPTPEEKQEMDSKGIIMY